MTKTLVDVEIRQSWQDIIEFLTEEANKRITTEALSGREAFITVAREHGFLVEVREDGTLKLSKLTNSLNN